jgi:hypothetical protein
MICQFCKNKLRPLSAGYYNDLHEDGVKYRCKTSDCKSLSLGYITEVVICHNPPEQTVLTYQYTFPNSKKDEYLSLYGNKIDNITILKIPGLSMKGSTGGSFSITACAGTFTTTAIGMPSTCLGGNVTITGGSGGFSGNGGAVTISGSSSYNDEILIEVPFIDILIDDFDANILKVFNRLKNLIIFS